MSKRKHLGPGLTALPKVEVTPVFVTPLTKVFMHEPWYGGMREGDPFGFYTLKTKSGDATFHQSIRGSTPAVEGFQTEDSLDETLARFLLTITAHRNRLLRVDLNYLRALSCRIPEGRVFYSPTVEYHEEGWVVCTAMPSDTVLFVEKCFEEEFGVLHYDEPSSGARRYGAMVYKPEILRAARVVEGLSPRSVDVKAAI